MLPNIRCVQPLSQTIDKQISHTNDIIFNYEQMTLMLTHVGAHYHWSHHQESVYAPSFETSDP